MDDLFEKMKKLIADRLEIDEAKITLDSSFRQDLGADSLDTYELVYAIEEELGISIPDEKANEFETVKDALEYIKGPLEQKKSRGLVRKVTTRIRSSGGGRAPAGADALPATRLHQVPRAGAPGTGVHAPLVGQ
jgi:acyl carrier protein